MDVQPVLDLVSDARRGDDLVLVGIGGHGGAGKTTLARAVPNAQVVSTDAFWNGDDFEIDRLRAEVVEPLLAGRVARFSEWDWDAAKPGGEQSVEPAGVVVVEGVCALHRVLRDAYAVRVWVDAPAALRLERGVARDGEEARQTWVETWMPGEERYVARDRPVACAQLIVDGSGAPPEPWAPVTDAREGVDGASAAHPGATPEELGLHEAGIGSAPPVPGGATPASSLVAEADALDDGPHRTDPLARP